MIEPFVGHLAVETSLDRAIKTGRVASGWMFVGPRGLGKAEMAMRFARRLLGAGIAGDRPFDASPSDPVVQSIEAGSHPDLRVINLERSAEGKAEIPVVAVRDLRAFFDYTAAKGGYRVAILDALDELNRFGANALLKTLEEPPPRSTLILIYHGEKPVPPTLRSRCRVMRFRALEEGEGAFDRGALVAAAGRPGLVAQSDDAAFANVTDAVRQYVEATPDRAAARLSDFLSALDARGDETREASYRAASRWALEQARDGGDPRRLSAIAEAWRALVERRSEASRLGLDPRAACLAAVSGLRQANR